MSKKAGFLLGLTLILMVFSKIVFAAPISNDYMAAGDKLTQEKNPRRAILYYKTAVQMDPQNWKAFQGLGNCELSIGQRENAINDFQKSLNINPKNPPLQDFMNKLSQTGPAPIHVASSLPEKGKFIWYGGGAMNLYGWQDLTSDYVP